MSELFRRRIKTVFPAIGKEFVYRNIEDIYQEFQMSFATNSGANLGSVTLYNLSPGTISQLKKDDPVEVYACYQGLPVDAPIPWKLIIAGVIAKVETHWSGAEKIVKVTIGDGSDKWLSKRINKSWGPGTKASQVVSDLVSALGMPRGKVEVRDDFTYVNGKVCGPDVTIKQHLEAVARDLREHSGKEYEVHVARGRINFHRTGEAAEHSGVLISPETGLIGHVEAMEQDDPSNMEGKQQYSLTSLLQPDVYADMLVDVQCELWEGTKTLKVVDGAHLGSGEKAFITKLVLEEPEG